MKICKNTELGAGPDIIRLYPDDIAEPGDQPGRANQALFSGDVTTTLKMSLKNVA